MEFNIFDIILFVIVFALAFINGKKSEHQDLQGFFMIAIGMSNADRKMIVIGSAVVAGSIIHSILG